MKNKFVTDFAIFALAFFWLLFMLSLSSKAEEAAPANTTKKPEWWFGEQIGKNNPMCRDFLRAIKAKKCEDYGCAYEVIIHSKKFVEPPWEEVEPSSHLGLIANLQSIAQLGARRFWELPMEERSSDSPKNIERGKYFVSEGIKMRVWRARLFEQYHYKTDPARPGNQTIVELRHPLANGRFGDFTFLVTPDLKEPDPQADDGTVAALRSSKLFLLDGVPYFLNDHYVGQIKDGSLETMCLIDYFN